MNHKTRNNFLMKKLIIRNFLILPILLFVSGFNTVVAQIDFNNYETFFYKKKELNLGAVYYTHNEREELRTDAWREYEKISTGAAKFQIKNQFWNYLNYKQEQIVFNFEAGPLWGNGNWVDSSAVGNAVADHKILGFRTNAYAGFLSRFYYTNKSFTLVQLNANVNYDLYQQHSKGTSTDSNNVVTPVDEKTGVSKFKYGFQAKAGWGIGRLNPVNNYMIADYLLTKYYRGRIFSTNEIIALSKQIANVKQQRDIISGHDPELESKQIQYYLNQKLLLTLPENIGEEWVYGEFLPRYNGTKVEFGPFFNYYNREPDFIYGGYFLFENAKYHSYKWNRNFKASINYNRYKREDWMLGEIDLGWSYFIKLRSQFDFGFKYIPGIQLNNFEDIGKVNHGFVPYLSYFSQLNSKARINLAFAWRISEDESLMLPGPEFSLSVYRSRY